MRTDVIIINEGIILEPPSNATADSEGRILVTLNHVPIEGDKIKAGNEVFRVKDIWFNINNEKYEMELSTEEDWEEDRPSWI